jgi:hypothetical protein
MLYGKDQRQGSAPPPTRVLSKSYLGNFFVFFGVST